MHTTLQTTFRHMPSSPALLARVQEHVERLERFHPYIVGCHVVIEAPSAHRRHGAGFEMKIDLTVPGGEIAVRSEHEEQQPHADVYVVLRDTFHRARRLLQDYARKHRFDAKHHASATHGAAQAQR